MNRKTVVIGFLGVTLDNRLSDKRWTQWRPTVALFGSDEFKPDCLELLVTPITKQILIDTVTKDIRSIRPNVEINVHVLPIVARWDFPEVYSALLDFARKYRFEDSADYYVHLATGTHVAQISLFRLTEARYLPAKLIGNYDDKQAQPEQRWRGKLSVIDLDLSSYDHLAEKMRIERADTQMVLKGGIETRNPRYNRAIAKLEHVAMESLDPILLNGDTGTGKTRLARRVHKMRARRNLVKDNFVEVNCATLVQDTIMSTLFGHKKGAFTGATSDRLGLLRSVKGGTLFLDEIGELPLEEQAKLLRALEDKRVTPMGSDDEEECDFVLIAGTNRDLTRDVEEGRFRDDLLARLDLWTTTLPNLSQRPEDIEANLEFELQRVSTERGRKIWMSGDARERFLAFAVKAPWPRNFRDFAGAITRMATMAHGGLICLDDVDEEITDLNHRWRRTPSAPASQKHPKVREIILDRQSSLDRFELVQLEDVLQVIAETNTAAEAGRILFNQSRTLRTKANDNDRLRKYLDKYDLSYAKLKAVFNTPS